MFDQKVLHVGYFICGFSILIEYNKGRPFLEEKTRFVNANVLLIVSNFCFFLHISADTIGNFDQQSCSFLFLQVKNFSFLIVFYFPCTRLGHCRAYTVVGDNINIMKTTFELNFDFYEPLNSMDTQKYGNKEKLSI